MQHTNNTDVDETAILRSRLSTTEANLREYIVKLQEVQSRFEDQTKEIYNFRRLLEQEQKRVEYYKKREETTVEKLSTTKEAHDVLKAQIAELSSKLASSEIPAVVEIETARQGAVSAREAREKAQRQLKARDEELAYTREQYQKASSSAAELGEQNTEFVRQVGVLTKKADEVKVELRRMAVDEQTRRTVQENERLKQMLKARDELLEVKEREIKTMRQGRGVAGGTRAATPRSPNPGARGAGSRAASPMPAHGVDRIGALRQAGGAA